MLAPRSAIPASEGLLGLGGLFVSWVAVFSLGLNHFAAAALLIVGAALPMLCAEVGRTRSSRQAHDDLRPWHRPASWLVGFVVATLPFLALFGAWRGVWLWIAPWLIVAPAFALRWGFEAQRGGAWDGKALPLRLGLALAQRDGAAIRRLGEPARQWFLKAFFIPLYAVSLWGIVGATAAALDARAWLWVVVLFAYTIDLTFALAGYVFAADCLGTGIRTTQRRPFGWIVCLACYSPFLRAYPAAVALLHNETRWPIAASASPGWLAAASVMLALLFIYTWATVAFGLRFSNLSNRGVIAHGPYRLMKHPAYFAHAANAWMTVLVLLPLEGVAPTPASLVAAGAITLAYRLRARTEEAHMSEDPDYGRYVTWIEENGLLARVRRFALARLRVA